MLPWTKREGWSFSLALIGTYSLCQKKRTFNLEFSWRRGAKNSHGQLCKWEFYTWSFFSLNSHLYNLPCAYLAPLPQGGHKKNSGLNVRFFWHRLYSSLLNPNKRFPSYNLIRLIWNLSEQMFQSDMAFLQSMSPDNLLSLLWVKVKSICSAERKWNDRTCF